MKLSTHHLLFLRLRMHAGIPTLPYMHLWHAELQIFSLYDSD